MKQIIVMTNDKTKYEKHFPANDFSVTWCPLSVAELLKVRDRSNVILVCADHERGNTLNSLGLYLREICIEDEKILYLYGNKEDVDELASLVPSMYIKKFRYSFSQFDMIVEEIMTQEVIPEKGKPGLVIIDSDTDYVERLRVHLDANFRVSVIRYDPAEVKEMIAVSDVVLISVDARMKLSEFMELFRMILVKKRNKRFRFYYLTPSDKERIVMNSGSENNSLSISKEMDVGRVARFIIGQFAPTE